MQLQPVGAEFIREDGWMGGWTDMMKLVGSCFDLCKCVENLNEYFLLRNMGTH
jgi:hypothetical protein